VPTVEMRCDVNDYRLFGKMMVEGEPLISENLLEFKCRDCSKQKRKLVFHLFNIAGELVETRVES